jgi:hypothetical protein
MTPSLAGFVQDVLAIFLFFAPFLIVVWIIKFWWMYRQSRHLPLSATGQCPKCKSRNLEYAGDWGASILTRCVDCDQIFLTDKASSKHDPS